LLETRLFGRVGKGNFTPTLSQNRRDTLASYGSCYTKAKRYELVTIISLFGEARRDGLHHYIILALPNLQFSTVANATFIQR
jgi:hypothetical protein